ncbi:hypothetical protein [Agrobacterium pusense]|uniref:hypothetical protein n=1 Tax=Agrobacterium pusense TaxID=648995 RepID=UPI000512BAD8|nr:hypothetical protein [Agrobacterium pusense]ANV24781.1 hypothetical protein BA939_13070 [Rhizobium sp. S41]KGE82711.1 hypothetical protein LW14_09440 [Rhizobium sp. H41]QWW74469.1 hypothetical protein KP800_02940 [Agrobacterium pusense]
MTAEIFTLPFRKPPVRLVFSAGGPRKTESDVFVERQLAEANSHLIGAQSDIAHAFKVVTNGRTLPEHDATMTGDTLESVLRAVIPLLNLSGASNRDRDLSRAVRQWLQVNGSLDHD